MGNLPSTCAATAKYDLLKRPNRLLKPLFILQTYIIIFAFLEDVVLGHTHCLHDQFDSFQVDKAILRQVAL